MSVSSIRAYKQIAPIRRRVLRNCRDSRNIRRPDASLQGIPHRSRKARRLSRGHTDVRLSAKRSILRLLLARRPDVLSKDELLTTIWPDRTSSRRTSTSSSQKSGGRWVTTARLTVHQDGSRSRLPLLRPSHRRGRGAGAAAGVALLVVAEGSIVALADGYNVIGRDRAARSGWTTSVSRRRAHQRRTGRLASIEDLDSTNGTLLNREPVDSPAVLRDGDVVDVESLQLTFRTLSDTSARTKRLRERSRQANLVT